MFVTTCYADFDNIKVKVRKNKHDHFRDEAEKGLLLTGRAPDTTSVRIPLIENRECGIKCFRGELPKEENVSTNPHIYNPH